MASNDPAYQREYYQRNKAKLQARKKERYRTDPEYRKAIRQRANISAVLLSLKNKEKPPPTVVHARRKEPALYLNQAKGIIDRDINAIYSWKRGDPPLIPHALYQDSRSRSMYSLSQLRYIGALIHKIDTTELQMTYREMRHVLRDIWRRPKPQGKGRAKVEGQLLQDKRKHPRRSIAVAVAKERFSCPLAEQSIWGITSLPE
jgi:hypothetical protein